MPAGSRVDGVLVSLVRNESRFQDSGVESASVQMEWWLPDLSGDLQSAIAAAVCAIERSAEAPSDNSITRGSVSSLEEYTVAWPSYAGGISYAEVVEEQWAGHQAESDTDGVLSPG